MHSTIYDNLEMYFPFIARDAVDIVDMGHSLTATLQDGSRFIYDDIDKSIRKLPDDPNNMTKEECLSEFGWRLYKTLRRKGVTEIELSKRTGIAQSNISKHIW